MTRPAPSAIGRLAGALVLAAACALGSCGYSTGLGVSENYQSVGVEFFGNDTLERDLEPLLHDQISRALRDFADVSLMQPSAADVVVRGTIRNYRRRGGIRSPENVLLETGVYIEVEASLHSRASDQRVAGPARASTWVGFVIADSGPPDFASPDFVASRTDPAESERDARDRALRLVSEQLVLELFAPAE